MITSSKQFECLLKSPALFLLSTLFCCVSSCHDEKQQNKASSSSADDNIIVDGVCFVASRDRRHNKIKRRRQSNESYCRQSSASVDRALFSWVSAWHDETQGNKAPSPPLFCRVLLMVQRDATERRRPGTAPEIECWAGDMMVSARCQCVRVWSVLVLLTVHTSS